MALEDRARALKELNTFATEITEYDDRTAVCERTIEAAESVLDFDICVINLERDGLLHIAAISTATPPEGAQPMSTDEGLIGKTYQEGESFLVEDLETCADANTQGPYRSAVSVPIGEHGVFQTVSGETAAFDEDDIELAELLVAHCAAALDRIEHTEEIQERTRRLERQNERLAEFASVVSHDLRNPLTAMQGYLELAQETGDPEYFERCESSIDRMRALIDDLLSLAREGESVDETQAVSLTDVAETGWETICDDEPTLELTEPVHIEADPDRLRQLLENLFRNAVEHGDEAVTVRIGPLPDGDGFFVEDNGPGIPESERADVFQAGYSTNDRGTGFGLSIVKRIAEAHGWGTTLAESADGGARFGFRNVTPANIE
ncbi:MAG: signal transduction histidine kinase [Natronomonas sp.]|jgi:signal transduction histidine kinase|uniref:sensor histidine kinase n=1 Tax=Natronomonas sp. TaxID=2184060 RepID=UPI00398A4B51